MPRDEHSLPRELAGALALALRLQKSYQEAPSPQRLPLLLEAIERYERLLPDLRAFPRVWAALQGERGNAYQKLPTGDRGENLARAIACYEAALRVFTDRRHPVDWAQTQNNLGNAYRELPTGDRGENLARAIACFQAALRVRTERHHPVGWATTQSNLGIAYVELPTGDRGENLARTIACYEAALRVFRPDVMPFMCQSTLDNLGRALFDSSDWRRASEVYARAAEVSERIRSAGSSIAARQRIMVELSEIFERGVVAAHRAERCTLAFELTERAKTRNLADRMWQRDKKPRGVSEEDWREYQNWLRQREALAEGGGARERGAPVGGLELFRRLEELGRQIAEKERKFVQADPDFVPLAPPLGIERIIALARAFQAVIVDFRVTGAGALVFLAGPEDGGLGRDQVVEIFELSHRAVREMSLEWLRKYYQDHSDPARWAQAAEEACERLYREVWAPVGRRLKNLYPSVRRLILIPTQWLSLLPLHAACRVENGVPRYLVQDYEIAYAPSCLVLERCLARERENPGPAKTLLAVQNPDGSLPLADWEVEEAARLFDKPRVLAGPRLAKAAVLENIAYGEEKLFSCHGQFNPVDPTGSCLRFYEDQLALPEVMGLDLRGTWLAVLSACETALVDLASLGTDEYYGLPAAFLLAGAQTVIGSLWAVAQVSTALLMQRFHGNLYRKGMAKAAALAEAQRWLHGLELEEAERMLGAKRDELMGVRMAAVDAASAMFALKRLGPRPFASPVWWAAFQCIGVGWPPQQ